MQQMNSGGSHQHPETPSAEVTAAEIAAAGNLAPWNRQFWPWFLIALPSTVVIASLFTVYLAFQGADTLVVDNYYRKGLAINQKLEQDKLADQLNVQARLNFDLESGEVLVKVSGDIPSLPKLTLLMLHPTDASLDQTIPLLQAAPGQYRADLVSMPVNRYYLRVSSSAGDLDGSPEASRSIPSELVDSQQHWRLTGEIDFKQQQQVVLGD